MIDDALGLSAKVPFVLVEMLSATKNKCTELGANGFFATLEKRKPDSVHGDVVTVFHFVSQPDYERFEEIKEAFNPLANIFMWSEVVGRFTPKFSGGIVSWEEFPD